MSTIPAPIVVEPSGNFEGDDGTWSSTRIRVGNPPQDVDVLVSTLVPETWVVSTTGCTFNDPSDCSRDRGSLFDSNSSSSWDALNPQPFQLSAESNLGIDQAADNGFYGYDTLGVSTPQSAGVTLDHQVIAAISTKDFYLGNLGLSVTPIQFQNQNSPQAGFLPNLKTKNLIPSLSYGYTAGAVYRSNTTASLTLGGYDASRFTPNDLSFSFAPDDNRNLLVGLQSITFSDSTSASIPLLPSGILTLIDSTVPHIWLPQEACQAFADAFQLTLDPLHSLYFVNETVHSKLVSENPSVTFQLGNDASGGAALNITLPYSSFDLNITSISTSSQRYFPLRQAANSGQYTLGRTFLQESFLTVDFERSNFSISQCIFPATVPSHIVAIPSINSTSTTGTGTGTTGSTSSTPSPSAANAITITHQSSHGLPTSAIAGIAIALVAIAILLASTALFIILRRKKRNAIPKEPELEGDSPVAPGPGSALPTYHDSKFGNDAPEITVSEKYINSNEIDGQEVESSQTDGNHPIVEMSADTVRSELSSPVPGHWPRNRSEMASPESGATRSGMSSPDPWETSRLEGPSPGPSSRVSRAISPELSAHRASRTSRAMSPELTSRTDLLTETSQRQPLGHDHPSLDPMIGSPKSAFMSPEAPAFSNFDYPSSDIDATMSAISSPGLDTGPGNYFGRPPSGIERSLRTDES